jgi:CHAT domain-containing protein
MMVQKGKNYLQVTLSIIGLLCISNLFISCNFSDENTSLEEEKILTKAKVDSSNRGIKKQKLVLDLEMRYQTAYSNSDFNAVPIIVQEALNLKKSALANNDTLLAVEAGTLAGHILAAVTQYSTAQAVLEPVLDLASKKFNADDLHMLEIKEYLSWAYGGQSDYDKELLMTDELIAIKLKDSVTNSSKIADLLNTKGINLGLRGDRYTEQFYLNKAIAILEPKVKKEQKANMEDYGYLLNIYNSISISYINSGDFENADFFARKAMNMRNEVAPKSPEQAISWMVMARASAELNEKLDSALVYINNALGAVQPESPQYYSYSGIKLEILNKLGLFEEAKQLIDEVGVRFYKTVDIEPEIPETYTRFLLANIRGLQTRKMLREASNSLNECMILLDKHPQIRKLLRIAIYRQAAEVYASLDEKDKSMLMYKKGLSLSGLDIKSDLISDSVISIQTPREILELITSFALSIKSKKNSDINTIKQSINLLDRVLTIRVEQQQWLYDMGIHEGQEIDLPEIGEMLLSALYELNQLEPDKKLVADAIRAIELCKANLLDEDRKSDELFDQSLPETLNVRRVRMRGLVFGALNNWRSDPNESNKQSLISLSNQYKQFIDSIQNGKTNFSDPLRGVDFYNAMLKNVGCTIDYFLGKDYIYSCVSQNNKITFDRKEYTPDEKQKLEQLNQTYNGNFADLNPTEIERINDLNKEIFQYLLKEEYLTKDLTIIPHGILSVISFESLDCAEKNSTPTYVIEKCPVHYLTSLKSLFSKEKNNKESKGKYFAGFAASRFNIKQQDVKKLPELATRGSLADLPGTEEEIKNAVDIMGGSEYQHTTRRTFLNKISDYRILLIGTHALIHRGAFDESVFLFEDEKGDRNYVNELDIAPLSLNAELTVLSACNTGQGKMHANEGPLSLGRAFFQAGCPSIVMSLWPLNDQTTKEITLAFLKYVKSGLPKQQALQRAKLDYLKLTKDPVKKHPYYWAGLILAGDVNPVSEPSNQSNPWMWGGILGAAGLLLYFSWRRFKIN